MRIEDGLYTAIASGRLLERDLDAVTENLANVATTGYKSARPVTQESPFARVLADKSTPIPLPNEGAMGRDWSHGPLTRTGGAFDVALGSDAFLQVTTERGPRFTRDGRLTTNAEGKLTRLTGEPVLDAQGGEIRLPPGTPTIRTDGTVLVNGSEVAKLGAFEVTDRNQLVGEGDGLYRLAGADPSASVPAAAPRFLQGEVEASNVNAPRAMVDMIEVHRSYEAVMRAVKTLDGLLARATQSHGGS